MSTQLNAQQGLTNLTPIKVIHILISLAIMVCFKFVPAAEPLTPCTMAQITPMKLMRLTTMPAPVMSRMGLLERLVMPSKASASILRRG